jgi:uncharacterized membrane protein
MTNTPPTEGPGQSAKNSPSGGVERPRSEPTIEIIPPSLDSALRTAGVDPTDPSVTKTLQVSLSLMMASGSLPLPPPTILSDYEKAFPGLVAKITSWTDEQRAHRMALENQVTNGSESRMNRGQIIAACVAGWGITLAALVGIFGNPYVASIVAIVSIGGPAAAVYLARGNPVPAARQIGAGRQPTAQESRPAK